MALEDLKLHHNNEATFSNSPVPLRLPDCVFFPTPISTTDIRFCPPPWNINKSNAGGDVDVSFWVTHKTYHMLSAWSFKLCTFIVSCGNVKVAILSGLRYWLAVLFHGWLLAIRHSQFITNIVSWQPSWMNRRTAAIFMVRRRRIRQRWLVWWWPNRAEQHGKVA